MDENKIKILKKIFIILGLPVALLSLVFYIPQVQEMIISFGENLRGRALFNPDIWYGRIMMWETGFLISILTILFLISKLPYEKIKSKLDLKILNIILIIVVSFFLLLTASQSKDIWYDETFSLGLARHSIKDLISLTAQDVHPPLYYILLKFATLPFPESIIAGKIFSVIPVILLLSISTFFFTKEFDSEHAFFFNILFSSTYSYLYYAVEMRMYSWCLLFCFLCCIFSFYIIKNNEWKYYLLYVLFAECGAYSHYWTAFGLAINFLMLMIISVTKERKCLAKFILTAIIGILLYLPWAKVVLMQVRTVANDYWIGPVTIKKILTWLVFVFPSDGILKLVSSLFIFYCLYKFLKQSKIKEIETQFLLINFLTPFVLIICATIISIVMKPVFQSKYLIPVNIFLLFFFTPALFKIKVNPKVISFFITVGIMIVIQQNIFLLTEEKSLGKEDAKFEDVMKNNITEKTVFVFDKDVSGYLPYTIAYKYPENRIYGFEIPELWANAYFYDTDNLIHEIENEDDLCYVFSSEKEIPEEFKDYEGVELKESVYPSHMYYFIKK